MLNTPQELVEQFRSTLPPGLSSPILQEYGLDLPPSTVQRMTQEILSLTLFWMEQAIRVTLPKDLASQVLDGVFRLVRETWNTEYELNPDDEITFFKVMKQEHLGWEEIVKGGGEPIAVFSEVVSSLELDGPIGSEDRQKLLALFLDLVPIEEIGEIAGKIEAELAG